MEYLAVQTLDGREVIINKQAIVTIGGARSPTEQQLLTDRAVCMVTLVDGKFITVVESCAAIKQRLEQKP
jgi:hypothetical protein